MTTTKNRPVPRAGRTPFVWRGLLAIVLLLALPRTVTGAAISFTSSAAFFSALGQAAFTTETFESYAVNTLIPDGTTLNGVTYLTFPDGTDGRIDGLFVGLGEQALGLRTPGVPDTFGGFFLPSESVSVAFPYAVNAVGIFFNANVSPNNTLQIVTTAGTAGNGSVYDRLTLYFVGLISDEFFATATIRGIGPSGFTLDDLTFAATVPEPAALVLLVTGLAAAGPEASRYFIFQLVLNPDCDRAVVAADADQVVPALGISSG